MENKPGEAVLERSRQGKGAQSVSSGSVGVRASELTDRADQPSHPPTLSGEEEVGQNS